ncbi:peroxiredoxin [Bauldia sp.]|uniref:peroxiredoxin n=1 Tax=Bauldia sp. TaxID=2575872 RepID=UPI003BAD0944
MIPKSIGDIAPDFTAETTDGPIRFHEWMGDSWCILFSHPKDFTPVCTTELGTMARMLPEFTRRGVKVIGISADSVEHHQQWSGDIAEVMGFAPNYPMIADTDLAVSKLYGMLPAEADGSQARTAADNHTVRSVFVIAPDKTIRLMIAYPMSTGRNFNEILRAIDALQMTETHKVATPANWRKGEDVIILPSVSDDAAKAAFPRGWRAPKPYIRFVSQSGISNR